MKKLTILTVSVFCFLISSFSVLQADDLKSGKISGFIIDKTTGEPIPDANIIFEGTGLGTVSKDGGFYFLNNLPQKRFTVTVSVIGYQTERIENVEITENKVLNIALTPAPLQMENIIITATRSNHLQSQVSMSSEVIKLTQPASLNGSTVGEIVQSATSTFTRNYGGLAGIQTASIRGANVDQVLVLLDGRRLNNAQGGGVDLNNLPAEGIDRIEILRGGHSALYGSDAIGGIINLITRPAFSTRGYSYGVKTIRGSFGLKNYNLFGSQQIGPFSYFISANQLKSNGDYDYSLPASPEKLKRENNDYQGNSIFAKIQWMINSKNYLQFIHQSIDTKRGVIGSVAFPSPQARRQEIRRFNTLKSTHQLNDRIRLEGQLYYLSTKNHYKDPGGWIATDDTHKSFSQGVDLKSYLTILPNLTVTAGAELENERLKSTKFPEKERNRQSVFVQTEFGKSLDFSGVESKFRLIPALRWDKYTSINAQMSPKFGALISLGDRIILRGNAGRSFRVPAFFDLFWPEDDYTKGNPNLLPEKSTDFDVGILLRKSGNHPLQLESTYFQNNFEDLIIWKSGSDWKWSPVNVGRAKITGLENSMTFVFPENIAHIKLSYTKMKAIDNTTGSANKNKRLIYRPDEKLDLSTGFQLKPFWVNVNYSLVGKRFTKDDNSASLPGYRLVSGSAGASFTFNGLKIDPKLEILNLLNKNIYVLDGYPIPGRELRFSVGVRY